MSSATSVTTLSSDAETVAADRAFEEYPQFAQGDAMVFVSTKYHCVAPVTRGTRRVCVLEYWAGEPRVCPHRCKMPVGTCHYRRPPPDEQEDGGGGSSSSDSD